MLGREQDMQKGGGRCGGELEAVSGNTVEPSMDWKETPTAHVFMVDLPGVRKEEVVDERVLKISGQRADRAAEEKGDQWRRVKRSSERFVRRTVRLPPNADTDGVHHAALENGVLTITIPKDNDTKPHCRLTPITN